MTESSRGARNMESPDDPLREIHSWGARIGAAAASAWAEGIRVNEPLVKNAARRLAEVMSRMSNG